MKKRIVTLLLALLLWNCATDSSDPRTLTGNKYDNRAIGLSLQFPASWQLKLDQKYGDYNIDLVALGPPVSGFSPNVINGISTHTGSATVDWNQILDSLKTLLQTQVADLGNYTDTVLSVNGISYAELSFTTTSQGNLLKIQQDLLLNKGKEISLTYTDFASRFDQNADFIAIHASMTLY